ncbi:MAG: glycosyltransferase [Acetobacteraceae bacterium]|nr:glycosyltransferase [Acetobacteraceae bacterium]
MADLAAGKPREPAPSTGVGLQQPMPAPGPLVSIIIPVYNGENYLRQAIDSALAQTYPYCEVIVVNDGSSDDGATDSIARSYGSRIRYTEKANGGVASALNHGIDLMRGDIFCWLSHDDLFLPDKVRIQTNLWIERGQRENEIIFCDYTLVRASGRKIATVAMDHDMLEAKPAYAVLRGAIHGCTVFIPRRCFEIAGLFSVTRPTTQDYALWFTMLRHARFVHIPRALILSRWHGEQRSKKIDHREEVNGLWTMMLRSVTEEERLACEGSSFRFYQGMWQFLRGSGIEAAGTAHDLAEEALARILVTIVIPFRNRIELAVSALNSALGQSHPSIEVVLVDDGSTDDLDLLRTSAAKHGNIEVIRQAGHGPGAARNAGIDAAHGQYIAFLDSDDLFLPTKIAEQLRLMEDQDLQISYTSYFRHLQGRRELETISTAYRCGQAYPALIANCRIATPTVMVRRDLFQQGFRFPADIQVGEDVILWIRIAARYKLTHLDRPLTIVRTSRNSSNFKTEKQLLGLRNIVGAVERDPVIRVHSKELNQLKAALAATEGRAERSRLHPWCRPDSELSENSRCQ